MDEPKSETEEPRETTEEKQEAPPRPVKKPYTTPVLTDLGSVADFAQGGSGRNPENRPGGPNMMKHP